MSSTYMSATCVYEVIRKIQINLIFHTEFIHQLLALHVSKQPAKQ